VSRLAAVQPGPRESSLVELPSGHACPAREFAAGALKLDPKIQRIVATRFNIERLEDSKVEDGPSVWID
jgi:hypothetical protein